MPSLDAQTFALLVTLAIATMTFVIALAVVPVVRIISVVRLVPKAPSRAGRR